MNHSLIPCEVFDTRSAAVQALGCSPDRPAPEKPLPPPPPVLQEVCGVTFVSFDYQTWTDHVETMQPFLRSLITEYGRNRVVVDFSGQSRVGTPSLAGIYSLWWALTRAGGRFAMCHLSPDLLEFFRWHDRGRLVFFGRENQDSA
jgi:hypothetical protein